MERTEMKRFVSDGEQLALYVDYHLKRIGKQQCLSKLSKHWNKSEATVYRKLRKDEILRLPLQEVYTLANVLEISPSELIEKGKA